MTEWDVFLAHAGADAKIAETLYELLRDHCRVFLDTRCLILGDDWDKELLNAQHSSRVTVVIVSRQSDTAYYQREEIAAAIDLSRSHSHRVVPIFYGPPNKPSASIPYGLRLKHGLHVSNRRGLQSAATSILTMLQRIVDSGTAIATASLPEPAPSLAIAFEQTPQFPSINFSVTNIDDASASITSVKLIVGPTLIDTHDEGVAYLSGPRIVFECSLDRSDMKRIDRAFGDESIFLLEPALSQPFRVNFVNENTLALVNIEIEYISVDGHSNVLYADEVIIVHPSGYHAPFKKKTISTVSRNTIISIMTQRDDFLMLADQVDISVALCRNMTGLCWKSAALICAPDLYAGWVSLRDHIGRSAYAASAFFSFIDLTPKPKFWREVLTKAYQWLRLAEYQEPDGDWDYSFDWFSEERDSICRLFDVIIANLAILDNNITPNQLCVSCVDVYLDKKSDIAAACRKYALKRIAGMCNAGCISYLVSLAKVSSEGYDVMLQLARETLASDKSLKRKHDDFLVELRKNMFEPAQQQRVRWLEWWSQHSAEPELSTLAWHEWSPRVVKRVEEMP